MRSFSVLPRRWPVRFTLRTLLLVVTILCVWLAIHTQRASWQRQLVQQIQKSWGEVEYVQKVQSSLRPGGRPSHVPSWLLKSLGEDFFYDIKSVTTRDAGLLPKIAALSHLEELTISDHDLTDDELAALRGHRGLKRVRIQSDLHTTLPGDYPDTTQIGDRSLAVLGELPALEEVYVSGYHFTARGLADLARGPRLMKVYVDCCDESVNPSAAEPFRKNPAIRSVILRRWVEHRGEEDVVRWQR